MKLKITQLVKNKIAKIQLETTDLTPLEEQILDQLGAPLVTFSKTYGNNSIKFSDKKLKGFKVKVEFDGKLEDSMEKTASYIDQFKDDIQSLLTDMMDKLSDDYSSELAKTEEVVEISDIK